MLRRLCLPNRPLHVEAALSHLKSSDPILARVIDDVGPYTLKPHRNGFGMLVRSILSQQISMAAARSIRMRLEKLAGTKRLTPHIIGRFDIEHLRSVGISPQKAGYLVDLARKSLDGTIRFGTLSRKSDEEIIETLTQVKGIGVWTAQMFLIFSAGRLDVFPYDDLGVRVAIKELYRLRNLPDKTKAHRIAQPWRPYASVASWYCWRYLDLKKRIAAGA
jgi:DNA-3-methyladenine glycosylase II